MILNYLKFTAIYSVAAFLLGVGALVAAYPYHPITTLGWVVWFLLALPAYVTLESIASRLFSKSLGYKIDESREDISVRRIVFGFAIAVTAMLVGMVIVLSAGVAGETFWELNFSTDWYQFTKNRPTVFGCDFNRSLQHLDSITRAGGVADGVSNQNLLQRVGPSEDLRSLVSG